MKLAKYEIMLLLHLLKPVMISKKYLKCKIEEITIFDTLHKSPRYYAV